MRRQLVGVRRHRRIVGVDRDDPRREHDEQHADQAEHDRVVLAGRPHRFLRALGLPRTQRLPDHRRGGVAQSPRRQDREDHRCGCRSCSRRARRCRTSRSRAPVRCSSRCRSGSAGSPSRSTGTRSTSPTAPAAGAGAVMWMRLRPDHSIHSCVHHRRAAADVGRRSPRRSRPVPGTGRGRRSGADHTTMLMALPIHSIRIAIAGSPAPRKIALFRNSSVTVALPANITCV